MIARFAAIALLAAPAHAADPAPAADAAPAVESVHVHELPGADWQTIQLGYGDAPPDLTAGPLPQPRPPADIESNASTAPEGPGAVLVRLEPWAGGSAERAGWTRPASMLRVDLHEHNGTLGPSLRSLNRCWFAVYLPPREPRGTAVLMPGMFGTPRWIIEQWTTDLLARDWAVLRMVTQPSRFTEFRRFDLDAGVDETARRVALAFDQRLGAAALAVDAAASHLETQHPALADLPRIALGLSGGALILPTVVAHDPPRYAATTIFAGGADLVTIVATSNYAPFIGAVSLRRGSRALTDREIRTLATRYLESSRLDPYATAPAMTQIPTLVVQGTHDRAVPALCGDLLWRRLGEPTRWAWPVGHEILALSLQSRFPDVLDWLDSIIPAAEPTP